MGKRARGDSEERMAKTRTSRTGREGVRVYRTYANDVLILGAPIRSKFRPSPPNVVSLASFPAFNQLLCPFSNSDHVIARSDGWITSKQEAAVICSSIMCTACMYEEFS